MANARRSLCSGLIIFETTDSASNVLVGIRYLRVWRNDAPSTREDRGRGESLRAHWLTRSAQLNKKLET